ncbi:molecular chaperone of HSP90 family [Photorhabdus khanii NC19]|uniref:Molecular chaperone of HSP90 family n=1 Tax=Photorhabdus khanii NC19 TaxID=1004151 RepID=W3V3K1_9GAMM|nr:ATP-binding protein [Photorhabdus khanii]ETS30417.1 molecular chaperone of HSP90 family [Photorhabdus khanii NC19]
MSFASLKFGGKLIEELSQKIPSSLFALNELIKNAYDAFSPDVTIKVSLSQQTIIISDRGNGMGESEIKSLFHISKSTKSYGHEVQQDGITRIIQGSKGLGFLSAFKFGDKVEWNTCKNGVRSIFSVRKSDLVSKEDVSGVEIPIVTDIGTGNGTEITVYASKEEINKLLLDLSDEKVTEKLAASVIDESFNINIEIENKQKIVSTNKLKSFTLESEDSQLFYVKYDSFKEKVEFFHKGQLLRTLPFSIERADYSISLELVIFHFQKGKTSKVVSELYKRVHDNALHPLIYINRNLFNNIIIFDPDVLRKKSSGDTLAQMIGRVCIRSQSEDIEFNSDRTNFVDNNLTRSLVKNLRRLNESIQTNGAELKKGLKNTKKLVLTGKAIPDKATIEPKNKTALILIDRKKPANFYIPSEQIDLDEYIFQVRNSKGEEVDKSDVEIKVDGELLTNRVLISIEHPREIKVSYRYRDEITGLVSTEITLSFEKQISNISGDVRNKSLFTIQSGSGYKVRIETVSDLIYAIDKVYSTRSKEEYLSLIACSIRAIFEISTDKVLRTHNQLFTKFNTKLYSATTKREVKDSLLRDVVHVLALVKENPELRTKISEALDINFSTFTNSLSINDFKVAIKNSHVGAHQSTRFLSKPKIETCADACGFFAVICDVLINIDKSEISKLDIIKVVESDLNRYFDS